MNLGKLYFFRLLIGTMILFSTAISSCGTQNKIAEAQIEATNEQPYTWRVEIIIPPNIEVYQILGTLSSFSNPISLNRSNDLPGKISTGTIVVYVNATTNQAQRLRQTLFEGGATGIILNKVNN
jgi:hypothetical protein